jgi:hypothetical protein
METDNRITLYWNANIPLDKEGKAILQFYNSDIGKKMLVTVEGIIDGHPVTLSQYIGNDK